MRPVLFLLFCLALILAAPSAKAAETAPTLKQMMPPASQGKAKPPTPGEAAHEPGRPSPRQALGEFVEATRRGDYQAAARLLDLRNIPASQREELGPRLAYRLKAAGARSLALDLDLISDSPLGDLKDGLSPNLEKIGAIPTPDGTVDIYLQRSRAPGGGHVWRVTPRTVAQIDLLYRHYGHGLLGEKLTEYLPDYWLLGMQLWQWAAVLVLLVLCYLVAWGLCSLLEWLLARRPKGLGPAGRRFLRGPVRLLLAAMLVGWNVPLIGPSLALRAVMRGRFLLLAAGTWCLVRLVDLVVERLALHMQKAGNQQATVLLKPVGTIVKVLVIMTGTVVWLDNLGFKVTTILASLGVGGIAVALAAQDTLKNFLGSIAILLDKPFRVGERIVVEGHDGFVEEIGLRSTKLRQLDGHQAVIPNELVARVNVENIGRRPHIRRVANLCLASRTSAAQARRAVEIVEDLLKDHEGLDPELPPRVYFSEFNPDSLNLLMIYWYAPPDFWAFQAFGNRLNLEILARFDEAGIRLAEPTRRVLASQDQATPSNGD